MTMLVEKHHVIEAVQWNGFNFADDAGQANWPKWMKSDRLCITMLPDCQFILDINGTRVQPGWWVGRRSDDRLVIIESGSRESLLEVGAPAAIQQLKTALRDLINTIHGSCPDVKFENWAALRRCRHLLDMTPDYSRRAAKKATGGVDVAKPDRTAGNATVDAANAIEAAMGSFVRSYQAGMRSYFSSAFAFPRNSGKTLAVATGSVDVSAA